MSARGRTAPLAWLVLLFACACASDEAEDAGASPDAGREPEWQLVHEGLDAALMSVSGTSARNVFAVGAHDDQGSLVLHFDGETWRRIPTDSQADLWWVFVLDEDTVFAAGTEGTILRFDPERERFERMQTPGTSTVFGIWGASEDDLFAVGGEPDETPGFVWRSDGHDFRNVTTELPQGEDSPVLFKVWGQSANDVFLVGMEGVTIHWDGKSFETVDSGQERRLFTVHGAQAAQPGFVAVGGFGDGVILEHDGTGWHDVTPEETPELGATPQLFGVHLRDQVGYAVGFDGAMLRRGANGWSRLAPPVELFLSFHAVWVDEEGGVWAVGGDVITDALDQGMLLHYGDTIPNTIE